MQKREKRPLVPSSQFSFMNLLILLCGKENWGEGGFNPAEPCCTAEGQKHLSVGCSTLLVTSRLAVGPYLVNCWNGTSTSTVKNTHGMSSTLPSRDYGMAVSVAFVRGQVEDRGFQAYRLVIAACFGERGKRRKFAV